MLRVLEAYPLNALGFHSSASVHVLTEAMRYAYRDRNAYLGDPAFVDNPVDRLLSDRHVQVHSGADQAASGRRVGARSGRAPRPMSMPRPPTIR